MARKAVGKTAPQASMADVLDRVLDRGIVIDAWLRVSVVGITLLDVDARVVVASISTYVRESAALARTSPVARPTTVARPSPTPPPAKVKAAIPPPVAPERRDPRAPVTLQCWHGCTFTRRAERCPERVRCPSDRTRRCPVAVLVPAA